VSRRPWTPEDRAEVCRRYPHERTADIARDLGRSSGSIRGQADLLGLKKSPEYMREVHGRRIAKIGADARFKPGQAPWNKGIPGSTGNHPNTKATQFKKGRNPEEARNYRPVGSVRVTRDGYLERKVTDDTSVYPARRWVAVHRLVWEAVNGPMPRGYIVVFKPGMASSDPDMITIDRVELISRAELMRRNTRHSLPPELNALISTKARLTRLINEREKRHELQD
jgi:hypothetical protein